MTWPFFLSQECALNMSGREYKPRKERVMEGLIGSSNQMPYRN